MSISNYIMEDNEIFARDMHDKSHPANPLRERTVTFLLTLYPQCFTVHSQ